VSDAPLERHCESCAFYRRAADMGAGICHRFPPQGAAPLDSFPAVSADSFCGEYERA
jgi:hypothetical protein